PDRPKFSSCRASALRSPERAREGHDAREVTNSTRERRRHARSSAISSSAEGGGRGPTQIKGGGWTRGHAGPAARGGRDGQKRPPRVSARFAETLCARSSSSSSRGSKVGGAPL